MVRGGGSRNRSPFSNFFSMTHGPYKLTRSHDPWAIQCCTTVLYNPWVMEIVYFDSYCTTHGSWRANYPWVLDCTIYMGETMYPICCCTIHAPWRLSTLSTVVQSMPHGG